uniref:Fibronectin type-III domain-containing protein n=1 Tax=Anabas testudineus TaxID=64144 RepID=A0A7N6ASB6_ANATE
MDWNSPVLGWVVFILLGSGHVVTAVSLPGSSLECTNDFIEHMFCQFKAENCSEHSLRLITDRKDEENSCVFQKCDTGPCCCSVPMMLIYGETVTANVKKGGVMVESKEFNITDSIKPKAPTIISVKESNGNYRLQWTTNMEGYFSDTLAANVTYYKKGDKNKVSEFVDSTTLDGFRYFEILGQDLEPSTTYVVSVRSFTDWSGKYSDSSEEWEFTTAISPNTLLLAIIISLSVFAVLITGAMYGCYVKYKTKWWDTVANPKLFIYPIHQEFLKPEPLFISSVYVEPLVPDDSNSWLKGLLTDTSSENTEHSSGISTGSSCLSYANAEPADIIGGVQDALCKAFPNISPMSPVTTSQFLDSNKDSGLFCALSNPCGVRDDDVTSESSGFDNRTYSILIPSCSQQVMTDSSEVQTRSDIVCDSEYHRSEGDAVACAEQQVPSCPLFNLALLASSHVPTDMSYHQCNADSAYAEDSSLSSASCDLASSVEAGCGSFDQVVSGATDANGKRVAAFVCDENPFYGHVPADSHSFLSVDDDYQAFQNLVGRSDVLRSEQIRGEDEEHLDKYPEASFAKIPPVIPGFINNVHGGLQRPLMPLMSAHMPIITESGYQSV